MKNKILFYVLAILLAASVRAQVKIGGTTAPQSSALLELDATTIKKGFLGPRIALAGTNDVATIPSPAVGLLIYNTATVSGSFAIKPGYYYYNGSRWLAFVTMAINAGRDSSLYSMNGTLPEDRTVALNSKTLLFSNGSVGISGAFTVTGSANISSLAGTGTRFVTAAADGTLATTVALVASNLSLPVLLTTDASVTVTDNMYTVILRRTSAQTVIMPAATGRTGRIYIIVNRRWRDNTISNYVDFDGATENHVPDESSIMLQSDGTQWHRIM